MMRAARAGVYATNPLSPRSVWSISSPVIDDALPRKVSLFSAHVCSSSVESPARKWARAGDTARHYGRCYRDRSTATLSLLLDLMGLCCTRAGTIAGAYSSNQINGLTARLAASKVALYAPGYPLMKQISPVNSRVGAFICAVPSRLGGCSNFSNKAGGQRFTNMSIFAEKWMLSTRLFCTHTSQKLNAVMPQAKMPETNSAEILSSDNKSSSRPKRKKLKGKRAVVRWLKFFRWKKKKEYNRLTVEEKILYKLRKAKKKEGRLSEALQKIEPLEEAGEITHDPEVLTPEEHFYLLKMGRKSKNYVPVGRRGVFQGVILNMHLHWKKHQTLKVIVKTFTLPEVRDIAAELARLTGGIVLEIQEDTIIMYRGKNYVQPPPEIMSPRATLTRKKALDKSKHRDALRAVQKYIPRLEEEMEALSLAARAQAQLGASVSDAEATLEENGGGSEGRVYKQVHHSGVEEKAGEATTESEEMISDSEDLSDIYETEDSDEDEAKKLEGDRHLPLYLATIEDFFADQKRAGEEAVPSKRPSCSLEVEEESKEVDEIDRMFLQATRLLRRKGRGKGG